MNSRHFHRMTPDTTSSYYDDDSYLIPSYDEFDALCMHFIIENIANGSYDADNKESIIAPLSYNDLLDDDGPFAHDIMHILQADGSIDSSVINQLKRACQHQQERGQQ